METVALHARVAQISRGSGTSSATGGCPRWKPVSKQATCGTPGRRSKTASMARQVVRLVQRRQRDQRSQLGQDLAGDDRTGAANRAPP